MAAENEAGGAAGPNVGNNVNLPIIAGPSGNGAGGGSGTMRLPRVPPPRSSSFPHLGPSPGTSPGLGRRSEGGATGTHQSCRTRITPIVLSQRWRVENFGSVMKLSKPGQCLRSQAFKHPKFPAACWQLCLYPGGKREENQGYVSLFLKMSAMQPGGEVYQKAEYLFYFLDDEGTPRFSNVNIGEFHAKPPKGGHSWGLRNIPRNKIHNALQSDGSLLILCEVELLPDIKFVRAQEEAAGAGRALAATAMSDVPRSFLENAKAMFEEAAYSDYVVEVLPEDGGPGREFRVHKAVLAAQSPVFKAMLDHAEMAEAVEGRLVLGDSSPAAVAAFLQYLYTGRIGDEDLEESPDEVLALAEKYGVKDLKDAAQDSLIARLEPSNVCQLIVLADMHSAHVPSPSPSSLLPQAEMKMPSLKVLKCACEALIGSQRKEIVNSHAWQELKVPSPSTSGIGSSHAVAIDRSGTAS